MKCKRCDFEMRREKTKDHGYRYVCPRCGFVIGGRTEARQDAAASPETDEQTDANEVVQDAN